MRGAISAFPRGKLKSVSKTSKTGNYFMRKGQGPSWMAWSSNGMWLIFIRFILTSADNTLLSFIIVAVTHI